MPLELVAEQQEGICDTVETHSETRKLARKAAVDRREII